MSDMILACKRKPNWCSTNLWLVRYRVKLNNKIEGREMYVTDVSSCEPDELNMEVALAVAAVYGGKRIRVLETMFIATAVKAGRERTR